MATKALTEEQARSLYNYMMPWQRSEECSAECAIRLIAEKDTEIAELKAELEDILLKDRGKTQEINTLTKENNSLTAEIAKLEAEGNSPMKDHHESP